MVPEWIERIHPIINDLYEQFEIASIKLETFGEREIRIEIDYPWGEINTEELKVIAQELGVSSIKAVPDGQEGLNLRTTIEFKEEE